MSRAQVGIALLLVLEVGAAIAGALCPASSATARLTHCLLALFAVGVPAILILMAVMFALAAKEERRRRRVQQSD